MADIWNLKINERLYVQWPNLWESLKWTEDQNWEDEALKLIYIKGNLWELE